MALPAVVAPHALASECVAANGVATGASVKGISPEVPASGGSSLRRYSPHRHHALPTHQLEARTVFSAEQVSSQVSELHSSLRLGAPHPAFCDSSSSPGSEDICFVLCLKSNVL